MPKKEHPKRTPDGWSHQATFHKKNFVPYAGLTMFAVFDYATGEPVLLYDGPDIKAASKAFGADCSQFL